MSSFLHTIRHLLPVFFLAAFPCAVFFSGCLPGDGVEMLSETDERGYQRGKRLQREGRNAEALSAFLSVIEKRGGDAPESHLEAAELFRTHIEDPVTAIYHYRKYLELRPGNDQAPYVRQLIETAMKDFARTLPAHPMNPDADRRSLLEAVEKLQRQNVELKQEVTELRRERDRLLAEVASTRTASRTTQQAVSAPSRPRGEPVRETPEPESTAGRYTVEEGDTLTRISLKQYGTMSRWHDIFEANRDILDNENSLRIGMVLRIPE